MELDLHERECFVRFHVLLALGDKAAVQLYFCFNDLFQGCSES